MPIKYFKYFPRAILTGAIAAPLMLYVLQRLNPEGVQRPEWIFWTVLLSSFAVGLLVATAIERMVLRFLTKN